MRRVYDHLDFLRGVETFLNGVPAASLYAMCHAFSEAGLTGSNVVAIADRLMDSTPLFLTGNTDTVYASTVFDLERDGPTVIEVPAGMGPGTINDAFFRFVVDMGAPGPDRGQGGAYLLLPPGWEGEVPEGYHVCRSRSYVNWLILRGFLVDGRTDAAVEMFHQLRIYPLDRAEDPPEMRFASFSGREINTIHANDFHFYEELDAVLQKEPIDFIDPELRGLFASVGLRKGQPFAPDERMRGLLEDAVAVGNATARAIAFRPRDPETFYYPDRGWTTAFVGGDYRWLRDEGLGGRNLDARTLFFYIATVNTPAMAMKMVGKGSQYALSNVDAEGRYLDGTATYRLRVPADVPVVDFWSLVIYDPQTRSELQTGQPFPSKNNVRDELDVNPDGSVDLYFAPEAPDGHEANWIQTVPGKGWFAIFRMYGPLEPWFDGSWKLEDFERIG